MGICDKLGVFWRQEAKKKDLEQALTSLVLLPSLPVDPPLPPTTAAGGANHDRSLAEDRITAGGWGQGYLGDGQVEQAVEESLAWWGQVSLWTVSVAVMMAVLQLVVKLSLSTIYRPPLSPRGPHSYNSKSLGD